MKFISKRILWMVEETKIGFFVDSENSENWENSENHYCKQNCREGSTSIASRTVCNSSRFLLCPFFGLFWFGFVSDSLAPNGENHKDDGKTLEILLIFVIKLCSFRFISFHFEKSANQLSRKGWASVEGELAGWLLSWNAMNYLIFIESSIQNQTWIMTWHFLCEWIPSDRNVGNSFSKKSARRFGSKFLLEKRQLASIQMASFSEATSTMLAIISKQIKTKYSNILCFEHIRHCPRGESRLWAPQKF